ncbi:hypothetical protein DSL72_008584 [Monilinia vaccinii-corymbosi]|uniref:Uncharacterized protein n=1 Tax=Monilinia vaccinii-corymbosi TaxID=61207 RepID=A0A8A3PRT1_9HELO|nr:hypothetical protein DSL72_008584 [Monilinia vaccinii-corymbosi]
MALFLRIQKRIHVQALGRIRHVGQTQVGGQDQQQPAQVHPGRGQGARHAHLHEGKERVEAVLGDVGPGVEARGEPARRHSRPEDDAPVDDRHEERVADDGAVEQGVQGLEGPRKAREERGSVPGVGECVEGGEEEVEGYAPVAENWWVLGHASVPRGEEDVLLVKYENSNRAVAAPPGALAICQKIMKSRTKKA